MPKLPLALFTLTFIPAFLSSSPLHGSTYVYKHIEQVTLLDTQDSFVE